MVVSGPNINNIMSGIENTGGVKQNNHKKKLRQRFDIIKKLGQGTFGKVQLGINKETGQEVAIKTIKKSKIESDADLIRIRREIQIMSSVQHPNIIHIYEVFENKEKMVLVMEYAAGGELYDYLSERKMLSEDEARRIFRQIATACYYCHKHKICHRDLKLENILLDENNNAKIADFGLSNVFDDQRLLNTFCGSPLYASPEIVKGTPYHGPEVDCWSLGVLLYTLVYGAMPFDGSNFKRLVKQISQGEYFEPVKPSPASPLIREMLTVNPKNRADIEKICTHWWVNETYDENCLDLSEELANQTPVRLDVLLSLAPPPPQLESDQLVVMGDVCEEAAKLDSAVPARSHSVGSIMDLSPAERRRIDLITEDKISPKRKLESTISSDKINVDKGVSRKEKIIKDNTVADITVRGAIKEASMEDASMTEPAPLDKSMTQTISREMDVEQTEEIVDPSLQGAACAAIIEEAEKKETKRQPNKVKKTLSTSVSNKALEGINENPSQETIENHVDKENVQEEAQENKLENNQVPDNKAPAKKKIEKKKVLTDKDENTKSTSESQSVSEPKKIVKPKEKPSDSESKSDDSVAKQADRRKSRTFEAAEKFQNMISNTDTKPVPIEKPKKILIPGVSVDGFKKEYERRASLTSTSPPKVKAEAPSKKIIEVEQQVEPEPEIKKTEMKPETKKTDDRKEAVRNAVNIISSALDKEGTRKSKSRPCMMRKPPVPFGVGGRSASGNIGMITSQLSPPLGPKPFVKTVFDKPTPTEAKKLEDQPEPVEENKVSSAEITLKSATLPRRKTAKAEIQLNYPMPKPATMEFKTEMAHNVAPAPKDVTQRSEVIVPVSSPTVVGYRASAADPETKQSKERIIPISFEKTEQSRETVQSPPIKPPMSRGFQTQKANQSQRSGSISRQSTQESDSETVTSSGEPIKKSPREYIIPIAVEGGGYVTPRAGSLEPSETGSASTLSSKTKFGRARRLNSRLSDRDSEDESPFTNLHRHSSFGKDSDTEESRNPFHMHRLRSTRPKRSTLEHNDSLSSGEEDDDEGFDNFTAENLFSTLLSRVRDLTQRLNVEDGARPGFPTSRLLSQFNHGTNFFNRQDPFLRHSSLSRTFSRERPENNSTSSFGAAPWRRSVSRDVGSDAEGAFNDPNSVSSRPRGDVSKNDNLNLSDLDLKKLKLSDEDALALSYLTPALSRRIQKQLLSQLAPSEAKKLHRTLSNQSPSTENDNLKDSQKFIRRSVDRLCSTLPRRFSVDKDVKNNNLSEINEKEDSNVDSTTSKNGRSFLPVKSFCRDRVPYHEFSIRSSSSGAEPRCDSKFLYNRRPVFGRSSSVREPRSYSCRNDTSLQSPESSISESLSRNDDSSSYKKDADSISDLSSNASRSYSRFSSEPYCSKYSASKLNSNSAQQNGLAADVNKTDVKKPSSSSRRISRFLRPDFFDGQKDDKENVVLKEKKEKELETQKVLKEIRDKRKSRLNMRRERSLSKDRQIDNIGSITPDIHDEVNRFLETKNKLDETKAILHNVSNSIKNLETTVNNNIQSDDITTHNYVNVPAPVQNFTSINGVAAHDYVNVDSNLIQKSKESTPQNQISDYNRAKSPIDNKQTENGTTQIHDYVNMNAPEIVIKKDRVSKIARPKSYPAEKNKDSISPEKEKEKESKISRFKKGLVRQSSKEKEEKPDKTNNEEEKPHKNKLLQSIEKKLEKFRSSNIAANKDPEQVKVLQEKKSSVEGAIKRLREQSLPRNMEHCTESGLIKRAVSVEEMPNNKPLQASRKSVTKILGLFKKYEEQDNKKKDKIVKKAKSGDKSNVKRVENKVDVKDVKNPTESVIINNSNDNTSVNLNSIENNNSIINGNDSSQFKDVNLNVEKKERPRSLMFDKHRPIQSVYNGAKSDSVFTNDKEIKGKSKLPVNATYRRSLNLDNLPEPPKFYKNPTTKLSIDTENNNVEKPDRHNLKLDFTKLPSHSQSAAVLESFPSTSSSEIYRNNHFREKRNSLTTPDDSCAFLSPGDDNASCDSWSVCSDLHAQELHSPISPNGHMYSGDENESVIDRIRRKSFYTRFNEKKRPRIPSISRNYKDLDIYSSKETIKSPTDYSSLDRRTFRNPVSRRSSYASSLQDSGKPDYKTYQRSSSLLNDYVNVPNRYQTYSSKIGRPITSLYSDSEDNTLDDYLSTAKSRKYSSPLQPSRLCRTSISPGPRYSVDRTPSSITSPTTSEPA